MNQQKIELQYLTLNYNGQSRYCFVETFGGTERINGRQIDRSADAFHYVGGCYYGFSLSVSADQPLPLPYDLPARSPAALSALLRRSTWLSQYRRFAPRRSPRCKAVREVFRHRARRERGVRPRIRRRKFIPLKDFAMFKSMDVKRRKKQLDVVNLNRIPELIENEKKNKRKFV